MPPIIPAIPGKPTQAAVSVGEIEDVAGRIMHAIFMHFEEPQVGNLPHARDRPLLAFMGKPPNCLFRREPGQNVIGFAPMTVGCGDLGQKEGTTLTETGRFVRRINKLIGDTNRDPNPNLQSAFFPGFTDRGLLGRFRRVLSTAWQKTTVRGRHNGDFAGLAANDGVAAWTQNIARSLNERSEYARQFNVGHHVSCSRRRLELYDGSIIASSKVWCHPRPPDPRRSGMTRNGRKAPMDSIAPRIKTFAVIRHPWVPLIRGNSPCVR